MQICRLQWEKKLRVGVDKPNTNPIFADYISTFNIHGEIGLFHMVAKGWISHLSQSKATHLPGCTCFCFFLISTNSKLN